jgi:hypothetical protein
MKVAELFEESSDGLNHQIKNAYDTAKAKPKLDVKKVAKKDWRLYGSPEKGGKSQRVVTTPDGKKKKVTGQDDSHPHDGKQLLKKTK